MNYIKPMQWEEFAQYLLTLKTGDTVEFATDPGIEWPEEIPDEDSCTGWYFARVIKIPEYMSRFILLDYCGGEEAFAIPLNNYKDYCDGDDRHIVPEYVKSYFQNCCSLCGLDDWIFVVIEEEDKKE